MVSRKLVEAVKLSDLRAYEIAHKAEMHPTTLSRILNGIEDVKPGDPRILRIGKVLGITAKDCFDPVETARS